MIRYADHTMLRKHRLSGWRRGVKLFGKPDFVWRSKRVALFVGGCFWHGCPRHKRTPRSRIGFWSTKLARNVERDTEVTRELRAAGWKVVRVWECALTGRRQSETIRRIASAIRFNVSRQGSV